jgi:diguanylate cyclase (GGDEF)-like protein
MLRVTAEEVPMLSAIDCACVETSKLFQNIDLDRIRDLVESCERVSIPAGERLLEAGTDNDCVYLLLSGELNVYPGGVRLPKHVVLTSGDCVGEMSLIDGNPVSALVVTARDCDLLVVPHDVLWALIDRVPEVARNLLSVMSGRVRHDNLAVVAGHSRSLEFELATKVDAVSGLHNRQWMANAFPRAIERCERDGDPLCLVLIELEGFAAFSDRHGPAVSETAWRAIAAQCADGLRTHDLLARYNETILAILLPFADAEEGRHVAARLSASIASLPLPVANGKTDTIATAFGVASLGPDNSFESLVTTATEALHRVDQTS